MPFFAELAAPQIVAAAAVFAARCLLLLLLLPSICALILASSVTSSLEEGVIQRRLGKAISSRRLPYEGGVFVKAPAGAFISASPGVFSIL